MGRYDYFPRYVPVGERKAKARKSAEKLAKKMGTLEPVVLEGRKIASHWWGKSWVDNLERYADYSNRLPRGKTYLRSGAVIDLKISKGEIHSYVTGSRSAPYEIHIRIDPISRNSIKQVMQKCQSGVDSVQSLLQGKFPEEFKEMVFNGNLGLFPLPKQINFNCSCPDWASMCKHVAAALYGVGTRLDEKPELFFSLRGIEVQDFAGQVLKEETGRLLHTSKTKSRRVMETGKTELEAMFGITMTQTRASHSGTQKHKLEKKSKKRKTPKKIA